ncbi:MAG: tRNA lysidine(34) synthetase TilS [Anaerolineales bacterium]
MLTDIETVCQENCKLSADRPVLVGVSGGADSLCLMEVLRQIGYPIVVAHFNHQLRLDSDVETNSLEQAVARKNIPSVMGKGDVRHYADSHKMALEEAARILRYQFLFEQARRLKAQAVAVGHTADDQVETVLMHFLRGAGLTGLKGMTYRSFLPAFDGEIPVVRPLLGVWREETVVFCAANGLRPYYDPSNDSMNFLRNRIRHLLIPELESYNPRFREAVWRTSVSLQGDYLLLKEFLEDAWQKCVLLEQAGLVSFDAGLFCSYAPGLQRNLMRRALEQVMPGLTDIRFSVLDRAVNFLAARESGKVDLTGGVRLFREEGHLYLARSDVQLPFERWPQMPQNVTRLDLPVPGHLDLDGGWCLTCEEWRLPSLALQQARANDDPFQVWIDASTLPPNLEIRTRRPGDRFRPLGMDGHSVKLSDFFINEKLPQRARDNWPLLCAGETVIWVPGYRLAHPFALREETRQVLYLTLTRK